MILLCSLIWLQDGLAQCVVAIINQPAGATKCAGENYTFTAANTGLASYQWQKNGVNLVDKAGSISGATTAQLTLTNLSATVDPGNYVMVATGKGPCAGQNDKSNVATLTVNALATITTQPTNQQVREGSMATFAVQVTGTVTGYQWYRNGAAINGATSNTYQLTTSTSNNGEKYKVAMQNSCGTVTSNEVTLEVTAAQPIRYVKAGATGTGDSWANASGNLQAMINTSGVTQVWVAGGTYKPTTGTDRSISFNMKNGVAIYGGFAGTETSLSQRPAVNPTTGTPSSTTLSGDIGVTGSNSDNSYHVFLHTDAITVNSTSVLDGFVITGGNADGSNNNGTTGGGMYNNNSSPTIINCMLTTNSAANGGGIYNNNSSSPGITNCTLQSNTASANGGSIYNTSSSSPTLTNCTLQSNTASANGGAFTITTATPR